MVDSGIYRHNYRQSLHGIVLSVDQKGLPPGDAAFGWRSLRVRIIYSGPGPGHENPVPFLDFPAGTEAHFNLSPVSPTRPELSPGDAFIGIIVPSVDYPDDRIFTAERIARLRAGKLLKPAEVPHGFELINRLPSGITPRMTPEMWKTPVRSKKLKDNPLMPHCLFCHEWNDVPQCPSLSKEPRS